MRLAPLTLLALALVAAPAAAQGAPSPADEVEVGGEASAPPELSVARAQAPDRDAEARRYFFDGRNAWDAARYADALELWNRAYALSPRPILLINIGNAWLRLERRGEAASAYRRFLTLAPEDAPERTEVETWVVALEGAPDLSVVAAPEAPRFEPLEGRFWTWVSLGVTAVTGGFAAGFYLDAESRYGAMASGCGATSAGCLQADIDSVDRGVITSQVLLGFALTAAVTSVVLYVLEAP